MKNSATLWKFLIFLFFLIAGECLGVFVELATAQEMRVSGRVLYNPELNDCLKEVPCLEDIQLTEEAEWIPPPAAVNILVRSTGEIVKSNREGFFEAPVTSPEDTLMFLYIGHNRIDVPLEGRSELEVKLSPMPLPVVERIVRHIMPEIEAGSNPDIDQLAHQTGVNRETARDILWLVLGNRPFEEAYPDEYYPDYRFSD